MEALSIPFEIGARKGRVKVFYSANKGVRDSGFTAIGHEFTDEMVRGFPVMRATVSFNGRGYEAMLGWVQIVSHVHREVEKDFVIDLAPSMERNDFPYCEVGYKPTMFDAPCNRPRTNMIWRAYTFLLPFIPRPEKREVRRFYPLAGFTWGYVLSERGKTVKLLDPAETRPSDWRRVFPKCLRKFPRWYSRAKQDSKNG